MNFLKSKMAAYDEFSEFMVSYLKDRPQYHVLLESVSSNPKQKSELITSIFKIWKQDPGKLDWFFSHEIIKKGL